MAYVQCAICMHEQVNASERGPKHDKGLLGFEWQLCNNTEFSPEMDLGVIPGNSKAASILNCSNRFENIIDGLHSSF